MPSNKPMADMPHLTGLYFRNLGATPLGIATVGILNLFTPLELFQFQKSFFFEEGGWVILPFIHPIVISVVTLAQYVIQRPVAGVVRRMRTRDPVSTDRLHRAQKTLLNLPYLLTGANLLMWLLIPGILVGGISYFSPMPLKAVLLFFFRAFMMGLVVSAVSFFLVESHIRKQWIPVFFPEGRLADHKGAIGLSINRRIRLLYLSGTSVPMIILLGTFALTLWKTETVSISAEELGREIVIFTFIVFILFLAIALRLNVFVCRSISDPVHDMLAVVHRVRKGDLETRVQVVSNDELGRLGDAGNDMIGALLDREKIRDAFGKYVNPEIRDEILAGRIPLDGERREATLLFSDLRDFTRYVEANEPEEVIQSMKAYFTAMQAAVHNHHGLVLQYVGDEVEAVFGVPLSMDGHADKAVQAALEMRARLEQLNRLRAKEGKCPFRHGIGIHSGSVLAGNTGSKDRLSYALIGNTVNLASRIQALTKSVQCDILISEAAVRRLKTPYPLKKESAKRVKGFSRPVTVYRLLPTTDKDDE